MKKYKRKQWKPSKVRTSRIRSNKLGMHLGAVCGCSPKLPITFNIIRTMDHLVLYSYLSSYKRCRSLHTDIEMEPRISPVKVFFFVMYTLILNLQKIGGEINRFGVAPIWN